MYVFYFFFFYNCIDDGQPEDIGYGYQKNLRNLENIFEQAAPSGNKIAKDELIEKFLDYLAKESAMQQQQQLLPSYNRRPWNKKSIFREREDSADVPDNLQQLKYDRYAAMPSAFRERYKVGGPGIARDYKTDVDDPDDYMYAINSLVNKYIEDNVEGMTDEELESFLRSQEKRSVPLDVQNVYAAAEPYYFYKRGDGGGGTSLTKRQFMFIPIYQSRRNNRYRNNSRWTKPRLTKRSKKNITPNETHTDPKVAAELNNIFLGAAESNVSDINATTTTTTSPIVNGVDDMNGGGGGSKSRRPDDGSKIELKKKSIDWSNYFGYDRK